MSKLKKPKELTRTEKIDILTERFVKAHESIAKSLQMSTEQVEEIKPYLKRFLNQVIR